MKWSWLAVAGTLALVPACGLKASSADGVDVHVDEAQVRNVLRELFPELTEDELTRFASDLDLEAALKLKLEILDIRSVADALSKELEDLAADARVQRSKNLTAVNDGYPPSLEPMGRIAYYNAATGAARIELSGVYDSHDAVTLGASNVSVSVDGRAQSVSLECVPSVPVDIVFLVDITGSMSPVIGAVRRSLGAFVSAITARQIKGTVGVVTFQDSVGVNVGFQQRPPENRYERSPFFPPIELDDSAGVEELVRFIARLQANSGADQPENLSGAIDFARNNVIGVTSKGAPNVIGDGIEDPKGVSAWPALTNPKQIFVAITDAPFHSDSRTPSNSSLLAPFKPRAIVDILASLQTSSTTVHVSDPSWVDKTVSPTGASSEQAVDSDFWAAKTGGLGEDRVAGYSLVDLDVLAGAETTGLLDILLDGIIGTTCSVSFVAPALPTEASFDLRVEVAGGTFSESLTPILR
jgi:hypothetical protein